MQNQHLPALIFAQSGRFIAQSATQAGYRVWVADCFGDQDTLEIAERWQQLAPMHQLSNEKILAILSTISQGENCLLICGSGIEQHYSLLNNLPNNITLIGNTASAIEAVQTPLRFFNLLKQLDLSYPETQFEQIDDSEWLAKSAIGFGGTHIEHSKHITHDDALYYQRYIPGTSGSGLFLANGKQAQLLSINQHYLQPCQSSPFRLGGIISPWIISEQHQLYLKLAINKITSALGLYGINSIDFIISEQGKLLVLEINPRISASAELLSCNGALFQYHISACNGLLPEELTIEETSLHSRLHYYFAKHDVHISPEIIWPQVCHDIPAGNSLIAKDDPICTFIIQQLTANDLQQHCEKLEEKLTSQLSLD